MNVATEKYNDKIIKRSNDLRYAGLILCGKSMLYVGRWNDNKDFNVSILELQYDTDLEWEEKITYLKDELKKRRHNENN